MHCGLLIQERRNFKYFPKVFFLSLATILWQALIETIPAYFAKLNWQNQLVLGIVRAWYSYRFMSHCLWVLTLSLPLSLTADPNSKFSKHTLLRHFENVPYSFLLPPNQCAPLFPFLIFKSNCPIFKVLSALSTPPKANCPIPPMGYGHYTITIFMHYDNLTCSLHKNYYNICVTPLK